MTDHTIIKLDRPDADMIKEIMVGEYMELTVNAMKAMKGGWSELSEDMQNTILSNLETQAGEAIAKMVRLTASIDHTVLQANLLDVKKGKKEITAKVEFALNDPMQIELYGYANRQVMVVLADPEDFMVEGQMPESDKDQPALNGFE